MSGSEVHVPVLIIGGGIVGLSASLLLSQHGVQSLLVERHSSTSIHPRARGLNRRAMEIYRGLGIDEAVREAGALLSLSGGIYQGTSLVKVIESHKRKDSGNSGARRMPLAAYFEYLGPVEGTRGTQDMIEPVLLKTARERGGDVRFNTECVDLDQDENGVTATLHDRPSGSRSTIHAEYVIAADGAGTPTRKRLGVQTTGAGTLGHLLSILFDADLTDLVRGREFSLCYVNQPGVVRGLFTSINNRERWVFHLSYDPAKGQKVEDFPPKRCQELLRIALGMPEIEIDIKSILPWEPTVRVAQKFQHGRVFLAGDSAHQMPPWGGQGATTGIADVHNLAWKLAAVLRKQAPAALLATYDTERLPIGRLVSEESGAAADEHGLLSLRITIPAVVGLVRRIPRLAGYGYSYTSQAIDVEDTTPLFWRITKLVPTLTQLLSLSGDPGTRVPHIWVELKGRRISTLDLLDKNFVVLAGADGAVWLEAAQKAASSLNIGIDAYCCGPASELVAAKGQWESYASISTNGAILVRPDGFVAWRAYSSPSDPPKRLEAVLGKALCL